MSKSDGDIQRMKLARGPVAGSGLWRARAGGIPGGVALVVLCLSVYLPGLWSLPPIDRDESRFAQASRQMFESGDFVVPRVQDRPRLNKPPMIYWAQCASRWVFGDERRAFGGIWVYRLPSVLAAIGTVLVTWRLGNRMFDPRAAWLGAGFLAICPMVVWDAHQARADQLLVFTVAVSQLALWRVWRGASRGVVGWLWPTLFWIGIAAGTLTKGPITPLVAGLTIAGVSVRSGAGGSGWRWLLRLKPAFGLVIVIAIVGPWVYAVGERVGWSVYLDTVREEVLGRSASAKEGHWGPPGYHALLTLVLFWPGVLLTIGGLVRAWKIGVGPVVGAARDHPRGRRAAERYGLAWIVPAWLVFELVGTKLPHYTMPLYPALALLSARALLAASAPGGWERFGIGTRIAKLGVAVWLGVGIALIAAPLAITIASRDSSYEAWGRDAAIVATCLLPACIALSYAARAIDRRDLCKAQLASGFASMVTLAVTLQLAIPRTPLPWTSERLVQATRRIDPTETRPLAAVRFHEDSLVFATRGKVARINAENVPEWLGQHPDGLVIVPEDLLDDSKLLAPVDGAIDGQTAVIAGYNYSIGKRVRLVIAERSDGSRGQ